MNSYGFWTLFAKEVCHEVSEPLGSWKPYEFIGFWSSPPDPGIPKITFCDRGASLARNPMNSYGFGAPAWPPPPRPFGVFLRKRCSEAETPMNS